MQRKSPSDQADFILVTVVGSRFVDRMMGGRLGLVVLPFASRCSVPQATADS